MKGTCVMHIKVDYLTDLRIEIDVKRLSHDTTSFYLAIFEMRCLQRLLLEAIMYKGKWVMTRIAV